MASFCLSIIIEEAVGLYLNLVRRRLTDVGASAKLCFALLLTY